MKKNCYQKIICNAALKINITAIPVLYTVISNSKKSVCKSSRVAIHKSSA